MNWETKIGDGVKQTGEYAGKFLANGGHAQQDIPAQHRLLNAGVMFGGWWAGDKLRDIMFGVDQISEGEYVPIKREDVPAPLRFLHKTIDWDPHSEAPEDQWKKVVHQLMPAVGAGVGAVAGSMYAFERNGRAQEFAKNKAAGKLNLMDADMGAHYSQAAPLRVLTAGFGTFSSASGLTFLYGLFLNMSFAAANGARIFSGALSKGNLGPAKALEGQLGSIGSYVKAAVHSRGEVNNAWAKQFVERVLEPLFGHELKSPEAQEKARETLQGIVKESYHKFQSSGKPASEIAEAVTKDLQEKLGKDNIGVTLKRDFGLDPINAILGNANAAIRWPVKAMQDLAESLGVGGKSNVGAFERKLKAHQTNSTVGLS